MSNIEKLRNDLENEENDLKAMGIAKKLKRQERLVSFQKNWLPKLEKEYKVEFDERMKRYSFKTKSRGIIDFYPSSNRLLIRNDNYWKNNALNYIKRMFLGEE